MAARGQQHESTARRVTVHCCFCLLLTAATAFAQEPISSGSRYYNRDGVYVPQDVSGYRTYVYKDRRYGYQPSYLDPVYRGPTRAPEDRYLYDVSEEIKALLTNQFLWSLSFL